MQGLPTDFTLKATEKNVTIVVKKDTFKFMIRVFDTMMRDFRRVSYEGPVKITGFCVAHFKLNWPNCHFSQSNCVLDLHKNHESMLPV